MSLITQEQIFVIVLYYYPFFLPSNSLKIHEEILITHDKILAFTIFNNNSSFEKLPSSTEPLSVSFNM